MSESDNGSEFVGYITPVDDSEESPVEEVVEEAPSPDEESDAGVTVEVPEDVKNLHDNDLVAVAEELEVAPDGEEFTREELEEAVASKLSKEEEQQRGPELDEFGFPVVPKELDPYKKELVRAFHRKTQGIAALKTKAQLFDAIQEDPEGSIKALIERFGIHGKEEGGDTVAEIEMDENTDAAQYIKNLVKAAVSEIKSEEQKVRRPPPKQLSPQQVELRQQAKVIHGTLSAMAQIDPEWERYESEMLKLVELKPTLITQPKQLYQLAKRSSRAISLNKRMKGKAPRTSERASQNIKLIKTPTGKKVSFNDAWDLAMKQARHAKQ